MNILSCEQSWPHIVGHTQLYEFVCLCVCPCELWVVEPYVCMCVRTCLQTYSVNIYDCMSACVVWFRVCVLSGLWSLQAVWQIRVKFFSLTDQNMSTSQLQFTTSVSQNIQKYFSGGFTDNLHMTPCWGKYVYSVLSHFSIKTKCRNRISLQTKTQNRNILIQTCNILNWSTITSKRHWKRHKMTSNHAAMSSVIQSLQSVFEDTSHLFVDACGHVSAHFMSLCGCFALCCVSWGSFCLLVIVYYVILVVLFLGYCADGLLGVCSVQHHSVSHPRYFKTLSVRNETSSSSHSVWLNLCSLWINVHKSA